MKKTILISIFFILLATASFAQKWEAVSFPVNDHINGISIIKSDTLFVVTKSGKFARSFDEGETWDVFDITPGVSIEDVFFKNSSEGYICGGRSMIMKTTDGGYSFKSVMSADTLPWFFDIEMFDDKHGLVVGMTRQPDAPFFGLGYRTEDGGRNWTQLDPMAVGYSKILKRSNGDINLLSMGQLHITKDFGKSWGALQIKSDHPVRSFSFAGNTGVICGFKGVCFYSHDNGNSWLQSFQADTLVLISVQMVDEQVGFMSGSPPVFFKTVDGGKTWLKQPMEKPFTVFDMVIHENWLYAVGSYGNIIRKKIK